MSHAGRPFRVLVPLRRVAFFLGLAFMARCVWLAVGQNRGE